MKCELLQTFWQSGKDYKNLTHMPFIPAVPLLVIYSIEAQLTLERYGFELCGPTYMWGFFPQ